MTNTIYIGMDIHTTSFTMCAYSLMRQQPFGVLQISPDVKNVVKYLNRLNKEIGEDCNFICGYEAGCLGYSLYHQLKRIGIECIILAPTTMPVSQKDRIKTDRRDAENCQMPCLRHLQRRIYSK